MHAIYIRGAILKLGSLRLKATAFARQFAGAVGGWSASVRHHARWSEAPLARALATVNTWIGSLAGKVPADVRQHLQYGPFRRFCLFNVDAEKTAWLCWHRLLELAETQPDAPPHLIDDFRRILTDEDRHGKVFQILADALGEDDRLVPGSSVEVLIEKIGAVGEFFLPRELRIRAQKDNPLGSGGPVWVVQGQNPEEKRLVFHQMLNESGLAGCVAKRAKALGKSIQAIRVAVKPTFMLGYHRKDRSIVTDPELLEELAAFLHDLGCPDVAVVEAPNIYDQFYRNRSVRAVAAYFGIESPRYRVVDLSEEQVPHAYFRGMAQYTIGRTWKEADFRITFGKMRSHAVEMVHLSLGNVEWVGARCDEYLFPERQAHRETAVMMLLDEFPPHFALLDGYDLAADGLVGMMGCPRPPSPKRIYAGEDALALDLLAARHLGLKDPRLSRILQTACHWFGDPTGRAWLLGPDEPVKGWRSPYHNEWSTVLSFFAYPVYSWGSGRGSLFVPEMDQRAFPPKQPESITLRIVRRGVQTLLGLRHRR
jgi:uncharacterized protein (DUF362 family)